MLISEIYLEQGKWHVRNHTFRLQAKQNGRRKQWQRAQQPMPTVLQAKGPRTRWQEDERLFRERCLGH